MSKPSTLKIDANFDVAQVSPTLECKFKRTNGELDAVLGKNAGSLVFKQGEEVSLQVNAGGDQLLGGKLPFKSFKIIDCTFTSRPRVYSCGPKEKKTVFAPPSPFEALGSTVLQGATIVLPAAEFNDAPVEGTPPNYYQKGKLWSGKLIVGQVKARWRLSLMVTVLVEFEDSEPEMRVYEIDPETEVDNGTGKPPPKEEDPEHEPVMVMAMCQTDPETEVDNGTGKPPPR